MQPEETKSGRWPSSDPQHQPTPNGEPPPLRIDLPRLVSLCTLDAVAHRRTPHTRYSAYFESSPCLEERLSTALRDTDTKAEHQTQIRAMLEPLRVKHLPTYEHSVRVGLLCRAIAVLEGKDPRALLFAGLLHDCGKALLSYELLDRTSDWSEADQDQMELHVEYGHRLLAGILDFTADTLALSHRFQKHPYPNPPLAQLHSYSAETKATLQVHGRLLALADNFDALHRINGRYGAPKALSSSEIKSKLLECNPDCCDLIEKLYSEKIFPYEIYIQ